MEGGQAMQGQAYQPRPERLLPGDFWVYSYKVLMCPIKHSHDWERCIYAHDGEKARRRHPDKYQAIQCPEARAKKVCPRGEECPCTHHLFEYWLHPDRYLTCLCELGPACNRPICFFAHHASELRPLPAGLQHSPMPSSSSRRRAAAAAADAAQSASRSASPGAAQSSSQSGVSRSSSPASALWPVTGGAGPGSGTSGAGSTDHLASLGHPRHASASSPSPSSSSSPGGSGVMMLTLRQQMAAAAAGALEAGAGGGAGCRPGFSALSALHTSGLAGAAAGSTGGAPMDAQGATSGSGGGRSVVVLQSPRLEQQQHQQQVLQQAVQDLQQLRVLEGSSLGQGAGPACVQVPPGSSMSSMVTGGGVAASIRSMLQQQQHPGTAPHSPCNSSMGTASVCSLPVLNFAVAGSSDGGITMNTALDAAVTPVSTPGGSQHGLPLDAQLGASWMSASAGMQLAALQAALEEPEQLSFSMWDVNAAASGMAVAAAAAQQQQQPGTAAAATQPHQRLSGFTSFIDTNNPAPAMVRASQASASSSFAGLAAAAADRLLLNEPRQQQLAAQLQGMFSGVPLPGGGGNGAAAGHSRASSTGGGSSLAARQALLHAWVSAAAAAAGTISGQAESGAMQALPGGSLGDGGSGLLVGLSPPTVACMASDICSTLAPVDAARLVQQLQMQQQLQRQGL